jgi:hypothetical protein
MDGNCVIGRFESDRIPIKAMTNDTTIESTGLRIKILNIPN